MFHKIIIRFTVNGEWGNWVVVSGCSSAGKRYRVRSCDSPSPNTFGEWCDGDSSEFQRCESGNLFF